MKKIKLLILALALLGLNPMQGQRVYQSLDQHQEQCELIMPHRVAPGQSIEVGFISDAKLLPAGQTLKLLITDAQGQPVKEYVGSLVPQGSPDYSGTTFTDVHIDSEGVYSAIVMTPSGNTAAEKSLMVRDGAYTVKPLFELFTSSTCGPCTQGNAIFDAVLAQSNGNYSVIKYQMNWPGSGDPYYNADGGIRRNYYSIQGVPSLIPNGDNGDIFSPYQMDQAFYDSFQGIPTDMQIVVTEAEMDDNNMVDINLSIDVAETYAAGLKLHIAILERTTVGNVGGNGELDFHHVMMKMLPDGNGTTLPALNPGTPYTLSQSYDMDLTFMEDANDLEVVVFVQNNTDKSIVQSETAKVDSDLESYTVTFNIKDESNNPVEGAKIFMQNYGTKFTGATGIATYTEVLPGTYTYDIIASYLLDFDGSITVSNSDVSIDVVMESSGVYFFEDFIEASATQGIPEGWTKLATVPDLIYCYGGKAILFKQTFDDINPIILATPLIDLEPAGMLTFGHGDSQSVIDDAACIFGYMTDPEDEETFIEVETFYPQANEWNELTIDVSEINGGTGEVYLAWKHASGFGSYFSINNVRLTYANGEEPPLLPPTNLTAEVIDDVNVKLTWDAPAKALKGYNVYRNDGLIAENISTTTYLDVNLPPSTYTYYVRALYDEGLSAPTETVTISITTGVDENHMGSISIYPNPASGYVNVVTSAQNAVLRVMDIQGRILLTKQLNKDCQQIDISQLNSGLYLFVVTTEHNTHTQRVIVK